MHDYFFDHPRSLADDLLIGGEVGVCGRTVGRSAFDCDFLLAQAHRCLSRLLFDTAVDADVASFDLTFAYGDFFFYHRNRDLLLTLDAFFGGSPLLHRYGACSLVRHPGRGAFLLLESVPCGSRARCWSRCDGVGIIAGPPLLTPLRGTRVH